MDTVNIDQAAQLAATDFSLWALFIRADIVVKLVMIGLIVASVMSWSIIIEKIMTYRRVRQQAEEFEALFWSGETLQNIYRQLASGEASPSVRVFNAAMREWLRHDGNRRKTEAGAIIPSIERALTNAVAREMEALESRLFVFGNSRRGRTLCWPFRHGLGHYEQFSGDCDEPRHQSCRGCAGHCGGLVCHRPWIAGRHSCCCRL